MNRQEVANWLRQEANKLVAAADALDADAQQETPVRTRARGSGTDSAITVEALRARLKCGSSRVPHLAKEFQVEQKILRDMVADPTNGIVSGQKGWLRLRKV